MRMVINKIRLIEIELFSYCNRTCNFCPNNYIDRHSKNVELDEDIFKDLINELHFAGYNKYISFSRYNEPFSHKDILNERIKYIRKILPDVTLVTNTNGDFDTSNVDIDEITEMDYDNNKEQFTSDNYKVMSLGKINNRGGALELKQEKRTAPCFEPQYFVGINYDGTVSPCCNIRNDIDKHKPFILGDLHNNDLEDILNNDVSRLFRDFTSSSDFPEPCLYCNKTEGRYTKEKGGIK